MNSIIPEFRSKEKFDRPYCAYVSPLFSPVHYHRHIEFLIVTEGELKVEIDGKTKTLGIGDCAFMFPYVLHSYKVEGTPVRFIATLEPECIGDLGNIMLKYKPKSPFIAANALKRVLPDINILMDFLVKDYCRSSNPVVTARQMSYLTHIFSTLIGLVGLNKSEANHTMYSDAVKICCDSFTDESFNVDVLSEKLNLSTSRIRQIFSENMGISPKKYISLLRIEHARSMIINTSLPISLISDNCGYSSIRTFNREFSAACGVSPTVFRENNK